MKHERVDAKQFLREFEKAGRKPAKGSSNSWADWEREAAKSCSRCGKRVTLRDCSVSEWSTRSVRHMVCALVLVSLALPASSMATPAPQNAQERQAVYAKAHGFMRMVWYEARRYFPAGARLPRVLFVREDVQPCVETPDLDGVRSRHVVWSAFLSRALTGDLEGNEENRLSFAEWARLVLVHEWAHYFQRERVLNARPRLYEGGAQAFMRIVAPRIYARLGITVDPDDAGDTAYDRWARWVERSRGFGWVVGGQFMRVSA